MRRAFLAAALLLACSCGDAVGPLSTMPHAYVVVGGVSHELAAGSYCWASGGSHVCADMLSPEAVLKARHLAPIPVALGQTPQFRFSRLPDSTHINIYEELGTRPVEVFAWQAAAGLHTYSVFARWPEGNVDFVFQLTVS